MSVIETKTFKSGNSVAVRLPKGLGFEAGQKVKIEGKNGALTLTSVSDPVEEKRKLIALVEKLRALGPIEVEKREPIEFPERPGL